MEKIEYCTYCNEEHVVSETTDNKGNVVGTFCNSSKRMINSDSAVFDGVNIYDDLRKFARTNTDFKAVANLRPNKVEGLARKMAFLYLQEHSDKHLNYAFVAYHMTAVITRLRSECRVKGIGGRRND